MGRRHSSWLREDSAPGHATSTVKDLRTNGLRLSLVRAGLLPGRMRPARRNRFRYSTATSMAINVEQMLLNLVLAAVFSVLGFVLLFVGYRLLDALTPTDMARKIFEEGNVAVSILAGAFVIGLAIVIGASIHG